ncbi:Arginine exporter protein ArgO [Quadrisphaera granulorum]|uniref:Arginine exporter protein ArgO n=1 Tax=Quadrisphaera granulorum TaxID=317664 RepID=A0A315ZQY2_9ACTN|nr:hypothetical protein [Quadrisphaera granulorum]PWJ47709.1 arginine exporter protein ArgO [Quadrisphaera granulorum]SZE98663.1 Arginine exporter protein ArgO [Quadrisphaera granulorum]
MLALALTDLHLTALDATALAGLAEGAGPSPLEGLLVGVAAGLAISVPFGALSGMLMDVGLRSTPRVALCAAAGVAASNVFFALVAATAGGVVSGALGPWHAEVKMVAAVVIVVIGAHVLRSALQTVPIALHSCRDPAPEAEGARSTLLRFVVHAAPNSLTTLTLTALATSLGPSSTPSVVLAFALGCGTASVLWHSGLALAGHLLGRWLTVRARRVAAWAGAVVTVGMAAQMVVA